jgi:hypothetical protein
MKACLRLAEGNKNRRSVLPGAKKGRKFEQGTRGVA